MSRLIEDHQVIEGVRALMKKRRVTLKLLSKELEIPYRTLQNYLNGESRFPASVFISICVYLGLEPPYIISNTFEISEWDLFDAVNVALQDILPYLDLSQSNQLKIRNEPVPPLSNDRPMVAMSIARKLNSQFNRLRTETLEKSQASGPPANRRTVRQ